MKSPAHQTFASLSGCLRLHSECHATLTSLGLSRPSTYSEFELAVQGGRLTYIIVPGLSLPLHLSLFQCSVDVHCVLRMRSARIEQKGLVCNFWKTIHILRGGMQICFPGQVSVPSKDIEWHLRNSFSAPACGFS